MEAKLEEMDMGYSSESNNEDSATSDDEAPESVSFGKSRQDALDSISLALKETRRIKEAKQEKRRARDAKLKQQKKRKVDLSAAKLSDSVLEGIAELDSHTQQKLINSEPVKTRTKMKYEASDDGDEETEALSKEVQGFQAVVASTENKAMLAMQETAIEFQKKHLYGKRIKRESVNKQISRSRKRELKPAVHFKNPGVVKKKKRKRKNKPVKVF